MNFGANMLALVRNEPQLLTLKEFLSVFLDFRIETITRRTQYELRKAEERDHLLQGLLIALSNLDGIIDLIRSSADAPTAKVELMQSYGLSEAQADAILQMQLRRLTALEAEKIQAEHEELQTRITDLQDILARRSRVLEIIETEVNQIKATHATPRRTEITQLEGELGDIDLIANEKAVILLTEQGYIKRMLVNEFSAQARATRGKAAAKIKEDDGVEHFLTCCDHDSVLFFSDRGVAYCLRAYQIPAASRTARGVPIVQMLPIPRGEKITSIVPVSEFTDHEYLVMLTRKGYIKKTALDAFSNIRANGLIAISLEEGDQLRWVRRATEGDSIIIGSRQGMAIHFKTDHEQLRPLGRATRGVKAMKLRSQDELISMDILPGQVIASMAAVADSGDSDSEALASLGGSELAAEVASTLASLEASTSAMEVASTESEEETEDLNTEELVETAGQGPWVLVVTMGGYGKRVPVAQFRLQNRAGMGILATKFRLPKDKLAALRVVNEGDELMMVTSRGIIIRQAIGAISPQSRMATGVRVQRLDEDDAIAAVALVPLSGQEEEAEEEPSSNTDP
jgi:DNA gyrase subunit A